MSDIVLEVQKAPVTPTWKKSKKVGGDYEVATAADKVEFTLA
jgi:hypothetical protein